jgi:hypothetical protein
LKVLEKGRHTAAGKELEKLGEAFCPFKLVPRHFDEIVEMPREALASPPTRACGNDRVRTPCADASQGVPEGIPR